MEGSMQDKYSQRDKYVWYILDKRNINYIFNKPPNFKFAATTVLAKNMNEDILRVSDILGIISYYVNFITANFDVDTEKYSQALLFLKTLRLIFMNKNTRGFSKECVHYTVDVLHEIADMNAVSQVQKAENAQIAFMLDALIDLIDEISRQGQGTEGTGNERR